MKELITALIAARKAVHHKVHKAGKNEAQGYKYVGHENVLDVVRAAMLEHGLAIEQVAVEFLGTETYTTRNGSNTVWRWRGTHKLAHVSGEERTYVFEATTVANDKAAFVASTSLDRTALLRVMLMAGSKEENPEHDSNEQDVRPAGKAKRTLEDVASDPLQDVADCGIKYDGKEPPVMPKGTVPIMPETSKYPNKSMDTLPVGYLRSVHTKMPPELRTWAEYLIKAHAYEKLKGGV